MQLKPFKKLEPKPDQSLEKFKQWVAAKTLANMPVKNNSNVLQLHPKPQPKIAKDDSHDKIRAFSFFNRPQPKPAGLFTKALQNMQKNEKSLSPSFNLSCNNCGGLDHNSASCFEPAKSGQGNKK